MNMFSKYSKALVIGAGSGRDIATAVLITEELKEQGIEINLAGFLTPWALHEFDGELEKSVNRLSHEATRKFIATKEDVSLGSYFEPKLVRMNQELNLGIQEFFLFSLHYGTEKLKSDLGELVAQKNYDLIIVVDVGGDILACKQDFGSVFTPIVDLSCLEIVASIKTSAHKYLAVVAPGVDGEISSQRLGEIISNEKVLRKEYLTPESKKYQTFIRVFNEINKKTNSASHTGNMIRKVVEGESNFKEEYKKTLTVYDRSLDVTFPVELKKELASAIYYFDLDDVKSSRTNFSIRYHNILKAYLLMKKLGTCGTEVDLAYIPTRIEQDKWLDPVFVLDSFCRTAETQRKKLVEYGIGNVKEIGTILISESNLTQEPKNLSVQKNGGFCYFKSFS